MKVKKVNNSAIYPRREYQPEKNRAGDVSLSLLVNRLTEEESGVLLELSRTTDVLSFRNKGAVELILGIMAKNKKIRDEVVAEINLNALV